MHSRLVGEASMLGCSRNHGGLRGSWHSLRLRPRIPMARADEDAGPRIFHSDRTSYARSRLNSWAAFPGDRWTPLAFVGGGPAVVAADSHLHMVVGVALEKGICCRSEGGCPASMARRAADCLCDTVKSVCGGWSFVREDTYLADCKP